jgi:hypothetical protein
VPALGPLLWVQPGPHVPFGAMRVRWGNTFSRYSRYNEKEYIYAFCFCFAVVSVAGLDSRGLLDDRVTIREVAERVCGIVSVRCWGGGVGTHPFITLDHIFGGPMLIIL